MNPCVLCQAHGADGYLCTGCTLGTADRLDRMPRAYAALGAFLQPAATGPAIGSRSRVEAPLPVAEPVLVLRGPGGIVGVLEDWRSAMQHDRPGWGQPVIEGDTARRIHVAARALSINLEWIASSWPMAGAFAEEIRGLELSVRAIVAPTDPAERLVRMGACPTVLDEDARCGTVLTRRPGEGTVTCRACGSTWPPSHALALARAQQDAANTPKTLVS